MEHQQQLESQHKMSSKESNNREVQQQTLPTCDKVRLKELLKKETTWMTSNKDYMYILWTTKYFTLVKVKRLQPDSSYLISYGTSIHIHALSAVNYMKQEHPET